MSSLVSDFLINPVLRQARRFSEISRTTLTGDGDVSPSDRPEDAVSESGSADRHCAEQVTSIPDTVVDLDTPRARPLSSSTQETRVEEPIATPPMSSDGVPRDHLGLPINPSPKRHGPIPEDDGMRELRARIQGINAQEIPSSDKARLMHQVLLEGYHSSKTSTGCVESHGHEIHHHTDQKWEPSSPPGPLESLRFWQGQAGEDEPQDNFILSSSDIAPTYAPIRQPKTPSDETSPTIPSSPSDTEPPLGCQHYERNVKLQCFTCNKWYPCRFCHDAREDHSLIRNATRNMLCMLCATPQKASDVCVNCGELAAQYYCNICKLWENRKSKPIYHCNDCGICRRGLGLGKDFFHCKTCNACITTSIRSSHKCIERSTDCDCPICGEYMFTSPRPVVFMTCGHSIHKKCYDQHMKVSYKCPICSKSLANMETQFRNLDAFIEGQPMPPEFRDTKAVILCNDCSAKSTVSYHWLGLKCSICRSYNTAQIQILSEGSQGLQQDAMAQTSISNNERPVEPAGDNSSRLAPISASARSGTLPINRRRHSSHAVEPQHVLPDRIARSLSPLGIGEESFFAHLTVEEDSEEDMLGFWRSNGEEDDDESSYVSESDAEDDDGLGDLAADDDEEDDDDIVLIGHR